MAVKLTELSGGEILEVRVSGRLVRADYRQFVPRFEDMVKEHGRVRVLFEMVDFHGWETGALWDDIKFDLKHFADIERLALVGEKKWEKGMAAFCHPFTTAKIRYFDREAIEQARAWIRGTWRKAVSVRRSPSENGAGTWAHRHFPNFLDCRPIFVRQALEQAGFTITKGLRKHMWIPVEVILGVNP